MRKSSAAHLWVPVPGNAIRRGHLRIENCNHARTQICPYNNNDDDDNKYMQRGKEKGTFLWYLILRQ